MGTTLIDLPNTTQDIKINNARQIIGNYRDNNDHLRGFFLEPSEGFTDIGTCSKLSRAATTGVMIQQGITAKCDDPRCSYERRDPMNGTIMHFDRYGNLIGRTKG